MADSPIFPPDMKYASTTKNLMLYVGIPDESNPVEQYKAQGTKMIFIITPEEKATGWEPKQDEGAVVWHNDQQLKRWFFENLHTWMGGKIDSSMAAQGRMRHAADILLQLIDLSNFDANSSKVLAKDNIPIKNTLQNWRWVEDGIKLSRFKNAFKDVKVLLIAAGPSLNSQWETLAAIRAADPKIAIMVCGRNYRNTMKYGVFPQFVLEAEEFEWVDNQWMFAPMPPANTILACTPNVCPGILKHWPTEKVVLIDHNTAQMFGWKVGEDSIDGGNSILHIMVNFAVFIGAKDIYLAGVDFGYPKGALEKSHCDGSFPNWNPDVNKQESMYQDFLWMPGTDGEQVQSSPAYRNFKTFLEVQVEKFTAINKDLKFWNLSPHGVKIEGTEYIDIGKWKDELCKPPPSSPPESSPPDSSLSASPAVSHFTDTSPLVTATNPPPPESAPTPTPTPNSASSS